MKRKLKIVSSGAYLPSRVASGEEVDRVLGLPTGGSEKLSGVRSRRYVTQESNSQMGGYALMGALERAQLKFEDLDALICASGSVEQAIPCNAALVQRSIGKLQSGIPGFDVNATCLSFVTALDMAASLLETDRFHRIAIVSSEIASVGLNVKQHEAYSLFGDGAACVIVEKTPEGESSSVITAHMETYAEGSDQCRIEGGGTRLHPSKFSREDFPAEGYLFQMEGRKIFRMVLELVHGFYVRLLDGAQLKTEDFQLIIPHQASGSGMELVRKKLEIPKEKYMDILADHGNMIAASIPLALHYAIEQGRIRRGDKVLLMGTSAGLSLGGVALTY